MSDGGSYTGLRRRYNSAISAGESNLRALLGSPSSSWKSIASPSPRKLSTESTLSRGDETTCASGLTGAIDGPITLHRKRVKSAPDVTRAICHIPCTDPALVLDSFQAVLATSDIRHIWDVTAEKQETLELVEPALKVVRTYTKVGWPSSPRDIVSINKVLLDPGKTLIDLSTSLSRSSSAKSRDDPPFLQPSPPYVRSRLHLCAFIITFPAPGKARLAMYWQWDLRASGMIWANYVNAIPSLLTSLVEVVREQSSHIPFARLWGSDVILNSDTYDTAQDRLTLDYGVYDDDQGAQTEKGIDKGKGKQRPKRVFEISVPSLEGGGAGWDIRVTSQPELDGASQPAWQCSVMSGSQDTTSRLNMRLTHPNVQSDYLATKVSLQRLAGGRSLRLNGAPLAISIPQDGEAGEATMPPPVAAPLSVEALTTDSASITTSMTTDSSSSTSIPPLSPITAARRAQAQLDNEELALYLRRNYATFLALLQSPAAKWKAVTEVRRVNVSSYVSIDAATTTIYKHEATFVNTSVWDIYSVFMNSGSRMVWDRQSGLEDFKLLKEMETETNDGNASAITTSAAGEGLTSFWYAKWKGSWPTAPRDAVLLRTAYKSPTSIHVFFTSVTPTDTALWRLVKDLIPKDDTGSVIRTQIDLQAIAIDQISPTTTSVTIVDQTNPKGWRQSGYSAQAAALANIGDFALKNGAPPVISRLSGARATMCDYMHEAGAIWKAAYTPLHADDADSDGRPNTVECVIRCDTALWSPAGLTLTVEPAHSRISALSRHRLSDRGPGCWLTIEHSGLVPEQSSEVHVTITKGIGKLAAKEKNVLLVNGQKIKVDVEDLGDDEVKELKAKKRIRNRALLLDQPLSTQQTLHRSRSSLTLNKGDIAVALQDGSIKNFSRPPSIMQPEPQTKYPPVHYALEGLAWLQALHADLVDTDAYEGASDWTILSYAENNSPIRISKMTMPKLSPTQPVFRVERTFPNVTAEQAMGVVSCLSTPSRTRWDDRLAAVEPLHNYQNSCSTSIWVSKPNFPLRSRITSVASAQAQFLLPADPGATKSTSTVSMLASASFPLDAIEVGQDSMKGSASLRERINPGRLAEGHIFLEGWVFETVETATEDVDDIRPITLFTKCSFFTCSDLPTGSAGSFGLGNARARLSGLFDALERVLKAETQSTLVFVPVPAMQIEGSLQKSEGQPGQWALDQQKGTSIVIDARPGSLHTLLDVRSALSPVEPDRPASARPRSQTLATSSPEPPPPFKQTSSSSSLTRFRKEPPPASDDVVVAEMIITRDSATISFNFQAISAVVEDVVSEPLSADTSGWRVLPGLPLRLTAYPMSYPTSRALRYLIRITLPTNQYTSPVQHPLASLTPKPNLPLWYRKLQEHRVLVHIAYTPVKAEMQVEGRPSSPLKLSFNGNSITLATEIDSKVAIAGLEEKENTVDAPKLCRYARKAWPATTLTSKALVDQASPRTFPQVVSTVVLPAELEQPRLVNPAYLPAANKDSASSSGITSPAADTPPLESLQRRIASDATIVNAVANIEKAAQPIVDMFTSTEMDTSKTAHLPFRRRTYRFSFVLLVAVISFLIGSLLRSLLSPNDYVFFTSSVDSIEDALLELLDPDRKWKYATRLLHLPVPGLKRDIIAAIVEKE